MRRRDPDLVGARLLPMGGCELGAGPGRGRTEEGPQSGANKRRGVTHGAINRGRDCSTGRDAHPPPTEALRIIPAANE